MSIKPLCQTGLWALVNVMLEIEGSPEKVLESLNVPVLPTRLDSTDNHTAEHIYHRHEPLTTQQQIVMNTLDLQQAAELLRIHPVKHYKPKPRPGRFPAPKLASVGYSWTLT